VSRSFGFVSCGDEVVEALVFGEKVADCADGLQQIIVGAGGGFAQEGLEFCKGHLDGVEVGAVRRQRQEPGPDVAQSGGGLWAFVAGQVVEDDHVAWSQGGGELGLDVEVEQIAVDRAVDHPRCIKAVVAQGGDEGLGLPVAERRVIDQPFASRSPAGGLGHVGLDGCFVNKADPRQHVGHEGLAFGDPDVTGGRDLGALLLDGLQVFFYA